MSRGFQFKQFFIGHDQVAMKVGTDGILLGSWIQPGNATRILDVGCGSGLLSIMLAQKSTAQTDIIGIDVDAAAVQQATDNAARSPWPRQLMFYQCSLQEFAGEPFDLIMANPPYYPAGQPMTLQRQQARQHHQLNYEALITHSGRLMSDAGQLAMVIPYQADKQLQDLALAQGLHLARHLTVYSKADKPAIRVLQQWTVQPAEPERRNLVIHQNDGRYSQAYRQLCQQYYLNF